MDMIKKYYISSTIVILLFTIVAVSFSMDIKVLNQHSISILNEAFIKVLKSSSKTFGSLNFIVFDDDNKNDSQIGEILLEIENLSVQIIKLNLNSKFKRIKILEKSVTSFLFRSKFELISFDGRWEFLSSLPRYILLLFDFQIEFSYLTKIFDTFKSLHCSNINIITFNNDGKIVIYSCIPFSIHTKCRSNVPSIVNFYNLSKHQWNNYDFFPSRLQNFYGCPVSFAMPIYPPAVMLKNNKSKTSTNIDDYDGSEIEIVKGLSYAMNFTVDIKFVADLYDFGTALSHINNDNNVDVVFGFYYLSHERSKVFSYVYP
jgi:hypothetical protein